MSISIKDLVATLLVAGAAGLTYANLKGIELPLFSSWRMLAAGLLVLGISACAVGAGASVTAGGPWNIIASTFGGLAFALALVGIITGNKIIVLTLAATIGLLWIATTFKHIIGV